MRLYLYAKTKTGYTPDWIQIEYADEDTNQTVELTMDIHGKSNIIQKLYMFVSRGN